MSNAMTACAPRSPEAAMCRAGGRDVAAFASHINANGQPKGAVAHARFPPKDSVPPTRRRGPHDGREGFRIKADSLKTSKAVLAVFLVNVQGQESGSRPHRDARHSVRPLSEPATDLGLVGAGPVLPVFNAGLLARVFSGQRIGHQTERKDGDALACQIKGGLQVGVICYNIRLRHWLSSGVVLRFAPVLVPRGAFHFWG
jgi:hypothetical protein